jgi:hypothetical protein
MAMGNGQWAMAMPISMSMSMAMSMAIFNGNMSHPKFSMLLAPFSTLKCPGSCVQAIPDRIQSGRNETVITGILSKKHGIREHLVSYFLYFAQLGQIYGTGFASLGHQK